MNDIITYFRTNDTICPQEVAALIIKSSPIDALMEQYIQELKGEEVWGEIVDAVEVAEKKAEYMENVDIPEWIDAEHIPEDYDEFISWCQDIRSGGCASGIYMPAVEYATATLTMSAWGEEITQFIEDHGYASGMQEAGMTVLFEHGWAAFNVWMVSLAVEAWADFEGNGLI